MPVTVAESDVIVGVYVVEPALHGDERGVFVETYRREWFPGGREMIQGNRADRQQGCVVGLHYHLHQADYWYVPHGADVSSSTTCARAPRPTARPSSSISGVGPTGHTTTGACSSHRAWRTASPR